MNLPDEHTLPPVHKPQEPFIMVVDDEPAILAMAKAILSTLPNPVISARSGEEAMELFEQMLAQQMAPEVVVLDLTMPGGISGFDVLSHLRQLVPGVSVIASSGFFQDDARDVCRSIGFTDALAKPYTPDSLTRVVRRALSSHDDASADLLTTAE